MQFLTRGVLASLMMLGLIGCHHSGRAVAPWRVQRVPAWPPPVVRPAPSTAPWSRSGPRPAESAVPIPTPDPRPGVTNPSQPRVAAEAAPIKPDPTESPEVRFKPVAPSEESQQPPTPAAGLKSDVEDLPSPQVVPRRNDREPEQVPGGQSAGPHLGFEPLTAPSDSALSLDVRGQRQRPVGGTATFDVVARNNGTEPLAGVVIHVEFDEALVFPGRAEKQLRKEIGRLMPGQSRELRLTLSSSQLGKHACQFRAAADGIAAIEHEAIVDFVTPKLQVELIGPARRTIGSRAEFTVKVANATEQPIEDLQVTLQHNAALVPHLATGGFEKAGHSLRWSLGRLAAGAGVQVQAEFDCRQLSEQACIAVTARGTELSDTEVESCLTVVAVPGLLDLRVSDRNDPVKVGEEAEFEITVQNLGLQPIAEVQLEVQTSEHLQIGTHSAKIGERPTTLTAATRNGTQRLALTEPLLPDATLHVTLKAAAKQPGDAELRVIATSGSDGTPNEASEFSSINP